MTYEAAMVNIVNTDYDLFKNIVEEGLQKEPYMDTKIICQDNEVMVLPKFLAGVLFPELSSCLQFHTFATNTIFIPDYSRIQIISLLEHLTYYKHEESYLPTLSLQNQNVIEHQQEFNVSVINDDFCETVTDSEQNQNIDQSSEKEKRKISSSKKKYYTGTIYPGDHPYKCNYCDKRFKLVGHVNQHERKHTGAFRYQCELCDKKFYQKSNFQDHQLFHSGSKQYQCPECNKTFTFSSGLKNHMKVHTGVKNYTCNICSKPFGQASNLKTHMRLHTGELPFICSECGKGFNTKIQLKRHTCKF